MMMNHLSERMCSIDQSCLIRPAAQILATTHFNIPFKPPGQKNLLYKTSVAYTGVGIKPATLDKIGKECLSNLSAGGC